VHFYSFLIAIWLVPGAGRIFSSEIIKSVSSLSGNLLNDLHYYVNRNLLVKPLSSTWITGTSVFIIICSLEIVQLVTNLAMITAVRVFRMPFILLQKKINMLFTSLGQSVLEKLCPLSRVPKYLEYPRPQAQFFPIQTSRLVNNLHLFFHLSRLEKCCSSYWG